MKRSSAIAAKCATSARSPVKQPTYPKSQKSEGNPQRKSSETTLCNSTASEIEGRLGTGANEAVFPWPPRELHPNARVHWATKAKAAKAYRWACFALSKSAKLEAPGWGKINLSIVFVPPDRRRRDIDGMLSAIKSGLDGLADALGVDDHRFTLSLGVAERVGTGGFVRVRVEMGG